MSLVSAQALKIVKATAPVVAQHALAITENFYPRMLENNPEVLQFFNKANQGSGRQPRALADAIVKYASNIDRLEALGSDLERIAHKHCALNVKAEHYPIVHDNLMLSIGEVLGDAVTDEVGAAWSEAVLALAKVLIKEEAELYARTEAAPGGWQGRRTFLVSEVQRETSDVRSMRFKPADNGAIARFIRGQYLTIASNPTGERWCAPRHYTLIGDPVDDSYRIAPRKVQGGVISSWLHTLSVGDEVELTAPYGPGEIAEQPTEQPMVFLSSGIGITRTLGLVPAAARWAQRVAVLHGDHSPERHAFREEIERSIPADAIVRYYYKHSSENEAQRVPHGHAAFMTPENVVKVLEQNGIVAKEASYHITMHPNSVPEFVHGLERAGVPRQNMTWSVHGPHVPV